MSDTTSSRASAATSIRRLAAAPPARVVRMFGGGGSVLSARRSPDARPPRLLGRRLAALPLLLAVLVAGGLVLSSQPASAGPTPGCDPVPSNNPYRNSLGNANYGTNGEACIHEHVGSRGIHVEGAQQIHTIAEGESFTYGIRIAQIGPPTATLTVTPALEAMVCQAGPDEDNLTVVDCADRYEITFSGAVTFTPSDWRGIKSVTVTAPDDSACAAREHRFLVKHNIGAAGTGFSTSTNPKTNWQQMQFKVIDNDCDGSAVAPNLIMAVTVIREGSGTSVSNSLSVDEGGAAKHYTVKLNKRPDSTVTIYAESSDPLAASVTPASRTFTQQNWNMPQRFTVRGERDADGGKETVIISHTSDAASSASEWWVNRFLKLPRVIVVVIDTGSGSGVLPKHAPVGGQAPDFDYATLIPQMYEWRNDPQWASYKSHTDRWDRALLALGETVADASLTPMSAAEAQAFADESWGTRWVPVAKALAFAEHGGQDEEEDNKSGGNLEVPDINEPPPGTPIGQSEPEPDAQQPVQQQPEPQADSQPQRQQPQQQPQQTPQQTPQPQPEAPATPSCDGTLTLADVVQANADVNSGAITREEWLAIIRCWDKQRGF